MKRATTAFTLVFILTGCAVYTLIEPQRVAIGDLYTVEPQIRWSSASEGKLDIWTVDGPTLQAIRFMKGLKDGDVLFEGKDEEKRPKFKKHMTPSEIMEFVVDSITLAGAEKVQATNLRPEKFGSVQGFRFEFSFASTEGLEGQGFAVGAVVKERLQLIMYTGVKAHYFPKHKDDVERIIRSIGMKSGAS